MSKVYLATKEDFGTLQQPSGVSVGEVGVVTWQYTLLANHLKLDGTTVLGVEYPLLLSFAVDHELVTTDVDNKVLFKYDETTDVLTLPDLTDLCVQGGANVMQIAAGLPNITGNLHNTCSEYQASDDSALYVSSFHPSHSISLMGKIENIRVADHGFDASRCSSVYSNDVNTVQPPAVALIPQIRYAADAATSLMDMIGHVLYDVVLRDGFIKANGAAVEYASTAVPRLVAFVREHTELLGDGPALYKYAEAEDTLTLPNFTSRVLQGGDSVTAISAGLPNITGSFVSLSRDTWGQRGAFYKQVDYVNAYPEERAANSNSEIYFNASRCSSIYGASSTVQPPAITLIPQIKY